MATTNVPKPTWTPNGFVAPTEGAILAGRQQDIDDAFGGGLNPALETPQGQIASSDTAIIGNVNDLFLAVQQLVDPAYSYGRYQDGIARIYFIERNPAEPTVVSCLCTGLVGTRIPEGTRAQDAQGNQYISTQDAVIGSGGNVTVSFSNVVFGPIPCPADSLTVIFQAIPGWDTINNPADGVIGRDTETRQEFEDRRRLSTAKNAQGSLPSVLGEVLAVPGVVDAFVTENVLNSPLTINGFTLGPNSLYVAVVGGDSDAVAKAIWTKKAPGCAYNGNTVVTVYDESQYYNEPFPAYDVKFEIPSPLPILFFVNIANNAQVPSTAAVQIRAVITAAFTGSDGGPRARIGAKLFASRFYAGVASLGAWVEIISITIGSTNNAGTAQFTASIATNVLTVSATTGGGAILPGMIVSDAAGHATEGTLILSQLSGTPGGVGTYLLDRAQTVASEAMMGANVNATTVQVEIDQVPTIGDADIQVVLS